MSLNTRNSKTTHLTECLLSLEALTRNTTEVLTYDEIGRRKAEQECLIAEEKMQKPAMIVGFTPEERQMFDNGIPMETVFERLNETCGIV